MNHRKLVAGLAVVAALGAGATAGLFLGVPGLSSAQTPSPSSSPTPGHHGPFGGRRPGFRAEGASLGVAAKDLGMTVPDLRTALAGGQSIAALARSKNVDPQKIVNDIVADATTRIDAAASSGKITAAQAVRIKAGLTARITALVNGTRAPGPGAVSGTAEPKPGLGSVVKPSLDIVAKDLNMTTAELKSALQGGQSIAALARSKNVDPQKIVNDVVADATTRIDAAASSGKITAAQAARIKAGLTAAISALVNRTGGMAGHGFPGPFPGSFRGPFGGPRGFGDVPTSTATPGTI